MKIDILKTFDHLVEQSEEIAHLHHFIDLEMEVVSNLVNIVKEDLNQLSLEELRAELGELMATFYHLGLIAERTNLFKNNNTCTQNTKEELS